MPIFKLVGQDKYHDVIICTYFHAKNLKDASAQVKKAMPERGEYQITPQDGDRTRRLQDVLQPSLHRERFR